MKNKELVKIFDQIALILELRSDNPFKIVAYQKAARNLEVLKEDLKSLCDNKKLTSISGIGCDLSLKIAEFLDTGKIEFYEELKKETPKVLLDMIDISGIGPKTAKLLYNEFNLKNIDELETLALNHKISGIPGIKDKTEENILRAIKFLKDPKNKAIDVDTNGVALNYIKEKEYENTDNLISEKDVLGDLHIHSIWSDGSNSIMELAEAAKKKNYKYIAIADHSKSLKVARGLEESDLYKKIEEIDSINKNLKDFKVLKSAEVEILSDGTLDYSDDILKELDIVIAAIHSGFKQTKEKLTKRIVCAIKNKNVNIIAHPTGGLLGVRESYEIDFNEICKAAYDYNTALEINSSPYRLDLNDVLARQAKEYGVKLALVTDAHNVFQMDNMFLGLDIARRAGLSKKDILNCCSYSDLKKKL